VEGDKTGKYFKYTIVGSPWVYKIRSIFLVCLICLMVTVKTNEEIDPLGVDILRWAQTGLRQEVP